MGIGLGTKNQKLYSADISTLSRDIFNATGEGSGVRARGRKISNLLLILSHCPVVVFVTVDVVVETVDDVSAISVVVAKLHLFPSILPDIVFFL